MIFAAGLGTRLKPLTDTKPKALIPVGGETLLGRTISRLMTFGYQDFVVNVHHFAKDIEDFVAAQDYARLVRFSDETAMLLETGGGLKKAAPLFDPNEPILIHNVDILDNVDYNWFANQHQADEGCRALGEQAPDQALSAFRQWYAADGLEEHRDG